MRTLLGDTEDRALFGSLAGLGRRARELGSKQEEGDGSVRFTARVLSGNVRLLVGMIRANQPWRLAIGLSKALTAALATGVFALVTPGTWQLGDALGWIRLSAIGVGSVAAITAALIVGAGLWEHTSNPVGGKQVTLFNLATMGTVVLGVLFLYAALLLLALLTSPVLVPAHLLEENLGHAVRVGDYMKLAWLASASPRWAERLVRVWRATTRFGPPLTGTGTSRLGSSLRTADSGVPVGAARRASTSASNARSEG